MHRFSELKKRRDGKFSKPLMKNFKIWLLSLKETFVDALNTSDIHWKNLNFVSSKTDGSSETGKLIFSQKRRSFPLEITAERGLWYGLIVYFKSSFV